MRNRRKPFYSDDTDYTTNSPSYYDDLARKQKLIQLLAEKIWEYENTLDETLEQIEQRLTDYILENDSLMTERLENWDQRIDEMPDEMRSLFVTWLNDGTLEQIINHDVLGNKADKLFVDSEIERLDQKDEDLTTQLAHTHNVLLEPINPPETDDTNRIQRVIDRAKEGETVVIPKREENYRVTGLKMKRGITIEGGGVIELLNKGSVALDFDSVLYAVVRDINILLTDTSQLAIYLRRTDPELNYTQLNSFYNVNIEGSLLSDTVSLKIEDAFTNSFYSCNFFRTSEGIIFDKVANANSFYGCEVRANNNNSNAIRAISHLENPEGTNGRANVFYGGAIENYGHGIDCYGGTLVLEGVYLEGFSSGRPIVLRGGNLRLSNCFITANISILGGDSLNVNGCDFSVIKPSIANSNYPIIEYSEDVATSLRTSGNVKHPDAFLTRYSSFYKNSVRTRRTIVNEHSDEYLTHVSGRLTSDLTDVTGDGTEFKITWGVANKEFDFKNEFNAQGGLFNPKADGIFNVHSTVVLDGLTDEHHHVSLWAITSRGKRYRLDYDNALNRNRADELTLSGSTLVEVKYSETLHFAVMVENGLKNVDVVRINANDGYSYYNITRA